MSTIIAGTVTNGMVVPASPLPEGARGEIHLHADQPRPGPESRPYLNASELLKLSPSERDVYLAAAAELAEQDYRDHKELAGFDAFSEELDDDSE